MGRALQRIQAFGRTPVSSRVATFAMAGAIAAATAVGSVVYLALLVHAAADGATVFPISISSDHLDFGEVPFHGSVVRHLVIRNDGRAPVRAWFFASGSGYSVEPRELLLQPGVETRVAVRASADRPGQHPGELLVHVDDQGGPLVIPLDARAPEAGEPGPPESPPGLRA